MRGARARWYCARGGLDAAILRGGTRAGLAVAARMIGPMLLAVDIGNTNVTVGVLRAGTLTGTRRAATAPRATSDELDLLLEGLLRLDDLTWADVGSVVCASVVPSLTVALEAVAARRDRPTVIASPGTVPIPVRVDRPAGVGADRLVNVLAAQRLYGAPAVVVDLGTATTFDCAAADGAYVGGAIAPGMALGLEALAGGTAKLPRVELRAPERAIGRDTVAAIQSGTVLGHQAMVGGLLGRIRRELAAASDVEPSAVRTIATGGLAQAPWVRAIEGIQEVDPELTLKGLAILHAEVTGGEPLRLELR